MVHGVVLRTCSVHPYVIAWKLRNSSLKGVGTHKPQGPLPSNSDCPDAAVSGRAEQNAILFVEEKIDRHRIRQSIAKDRPSRFVQRLVNTNVRSDPDTLVVARIHDDGMNGETARSRR
jgi:hypothetical protein